MARSIRPRSSRPRLRAWLLGACAGATLAAGSGGAWAAPKTRPIPGWVWPWVVVVDTLTGQSAPR